jgi:hypothetical protein
MLTRKPHKGDMLLFRELLPTGKVGEPLPGVYEVIEAKDDGICWFTVPGKDPSCFIWRFSDGFNKLAEIVP